MNERKIIPIGTVFCRLTVLGEAPVKNGHSQSLCRCTCEVVRSYTNKELRSGKAKSCGCLRADKARLLATKHGHAGNAEKGRRPSSEYSTWLQMWRRCTTPSNKGYRLYGARGIGVCDRWKNFETFLADMGPRPSTRHSIDRFPNNDGNYEPGNCRWATASQQMSNRRPYKRKKKVSSPIQLPSAGTRSSDLLDSSSN